MSISPASAPRLLARGVAVAAMTIGLLGAAAAPVSHDPREPTEREPLQYVALGDSFSSGVGAGQYVNECGVSGLGFPALIDQRRAVELVANPSCGGATTEDVLSSQLESLDDDTDLVTITVGGNDIGFGAIAAGCSADPSSADCTRAIQAAVSSVRKELPAKLAGTFAAIRQQAPNAHVVVLGYPHLVSPKFGQSNTANQGEERLNAGVDLLNAAIRQTARTAGFEYIDVTKEFRNHGVGAPRSWIHGADGAAFHPTDEGYKKGYLKAFKTEVQVNKLQKTAAE